MEDADVVHLAAVMRINVGILPCKSCSVCILTAGFALAEFRSGPMTARDLRGCQIPVAAARVSENRGMAHLAPSAERVEYSRTRELAEIGVQMNWPAMIL
jgi:hypothetical protein